MGLFAGQQVRAGLGVSTILPEFDFETYSEAGFVWLPGWNEQIPAGWKWTRGKLGIQPAKVKEHLGRWTCLPGAAGSKKGLTIVGAAAYANHASTIVLSLFYDLHDGRGPRFWRPGMPNPQELFDHVARGGLLSAWNCSFENWIWNSVCTRRYGWPPLNPRVLRCDMAKSRAHAYPGGLAEAGRVMNLRVQKDADGKRLLDKFSIPRNPTQSDPRTRILPEQDSEGSRLYQYNLVDIQAEHEAGTRLPDLSPFELEYWQAEQRINHRGVAIDQKALADCIYVVERALEQLDAELRALTGGIKSTEVQQLLGWLGAHGCHMDSLDEEHLEAELKRLYPHPPAPLPKNPVRRVLEIRALSASASVKKLFAIRNQLSPWGRLHDLFNYYGARTGRETANGPQPQNLVKSGPPSRQCTKCNHHYGARLQDICAWCGAQDAGETSEWGLRAAEDALATMATRDLALIERVWGDVLAAVAGCLRGLFVAGPGKELVSSDYASIEGAVLAELSGCDWRREVFRTHGKIYEMSASKITGIPFQEFLDYKAKNGRHHPMRGKLGKFAELGSGFGGWIQAWKNFGADEYLNDEEIKKSILAWRAASSEIPELWGGQERNWRPELWGLEGMAVAALQNPGQYFWVRNLSFLYWEDTLYLGLPSGRHLVYHSPRLEQHEDPKRKGFAISYEGWNTNPKAGAGGWVRMYVYGGKFCENVVQAVARDILVHAIVNLERAGLWVVLHVHDEIVVEVERGTTTVADVERIMNILPPWAKGWAVFARGGWIGFRFRKDG